MKYKSNCHVVLVFLVYFSQSGAFSIDDLETLALQESSDCGGFLDVNTGMISYKYGQNYSSDEICVWTVHIKSKSQINVQLLADGFEVNGFYTKISIYVPSRDLANSTQPLELAHEIRRGDRATRNITGSFMYVVFATWNDYRGQGFILTFQGLNEIDYPMVYDLQDSFNTTGLFEYDSAYDPLVGETDSLTFSMVLHSASNSVTISNFENALSPDINSIGMNVLGLYVYEIYWMGPTPLLHLPYSMSYINTTIGISSKRPTLIFFSCSGCNGTVTLEWD